MKTGKYRKNILAAALAAALALSLGAVGALASGDEVYINGSPQPGTLDGMYALGSGGVTQLSGSGQYVMTADGLAQLGSGASVPEGDPEHLEVTGTLELPYDKVRVALYYYADESSVRNPTLDYANLENEVGSGYDFARSAGAAFDNMDYCSCYGGSVPVSGFQASLRCNINYNGAIWVNTAGERVFNEPAATSMDKRTVWRTADQNIIYIVLAENMLSDDSALFTGMMSNSAPFTNEEKIAELLDEGYMFKADTIEELGEMIGAEKLAETVAKYNEDVAAGEDTVFGRTDNLLAFEEGPFYAVYTVPYLMMTAGGPRINGDAQLVREDGTLVGGAYLAGEIIGSALGTAVEGFKSSRLWEVFGEIDGYVKPPETLNDDITFELALLEAFREKGYAIDSDDIADKWVGLIPFAYTAEEVALRHMRSGIYPPQSGYLVNPYREMIGAAMRAAICGALAPGRPRHSRGGLQRGARLDGLRRDRHAHRSGEGDARHPDGQRVLHRARVRLRGVREIGDLPRGVGAVRGKIQALQLGALLPEHGLRGDRDLLRGQRLPKGDEHPDDVRAGQRLHRRPDRARLRRDARDGGARQKVHRAARGPAGHLRAHDGDPEHHLPFGKDDRRDLKALAGITDPGGKEAS